MYLKKNRARFFKLFGVLFLPQVINTSDKDHIHDVSPLDPQPVTAPSSCLSQPGTGALRWWKDTLCKSTACFGPEGSCSARSRTRWPGREQGRVLRGGGGVCQRSHLCQAPTWCLLAAAVRPSFPSTSKPLPQVDGLNCN